MSRYPAKITDEMLAKSSHISDETIENDIEDTTSEIDQLLAEYNLYRNTTDRAESFRQIMRLEAIRKRQEFVKFLTAVMDKRKEGRTKCYNSIL